MLLIIWKTNLSLQQFCRPRSAVRNKNHAKLCEPPCLRELTVWGYGRKKGNVGKQMGKGEANSEMVMISVIVSEYLIVSLLRGQRKKPLFYSSIKGWMLIR